MTDEQTEIEIQDSDLKSNDSDVDTGNVLVVTLNGNSSELGASIKLITLSSTIPRTHQY